jgi:hypothetical protein
MVIHIIHNISSLYSQSVDKKWVQAEMSFKAFSYAFLYHARLEDRNLGL